MRKALVIGINKYDQNPLKFCINDAKCVGEILEKNGSGSPNFEVVFKYDIKTSAELLSIIISFFSGQCDTALLYFAGHGYFTNIGGYILSTDLQMGVSMNELLTITNQSPITN
ncbi:MAG: caspase family protein, partial [Mariniphaga sp.]